MIQLNRNKIKLFNIFFVPILCCFWLYSLLNLSNVDLAYRSCAILPLFFLIGYVLLFVVKKKKICDIHLIIMLLFFVKLFILPELVIFTGTFDISRMNSDLLRNIGDAVLLQSLEWITIVCCLCVMNINKSEIKYFDRKWDTLASKKVWRVILVCFLIIIMSMIVYPSLTYKFRPVFFASETEEILWKQMSTVAVSTINSAIYYPLNWLITVTRLSFVYFLIIKIWKKREKKSNVVSIIVSIFVIVLGLVVIVPDDVAASIIAAVCLFVMLTKLYPDKRRAIVNILLLAASLFFIYVFFGKAFSGEAKITDSFSLLSRRLNVYFSGFVNMAASLDMKAPDKLTYFAGDFLRSFPVIKGFFVNMPTTTELFNSALGYDVIYNSQIIPLEGQAYFYFNFIGVIIAPIIVTKICVYFYNKMLCSSSTYEYFIYCFYSLLFAFGLVMYDNFLMLYLFLSYVPLYLIGIFIKRRRRDERVNLS